MGGSGRQREEAQAGTEGGLGRQIVGVQAVREENPDRQMKAHKPEKRGNDKQGG